MVHRYLDRIAVRLEPGAEDGGNAGNEGDAIPVDSVRPGTQFIWRNRLYVVREVLAHWSESTPWWQPVSAEVLGVAGGVAVGGSAAGGSAGGARAGSASTTVQVWRVVAGIGRRHPAGAVLDLLRHADCAGPAGSAQWQLARAID